ncbi:MAG: hypothetical protein ACF8R9_14880 [Phycisphaerales bacterium JB054]
MKTSMATALVVGAISSVGAAAPTTLDFDSIPTGGTVQSFSEFGGLTWTDMSAMSNSFYQSYYHNSGAFPSGPNAAYNSYGRTTVSAASGIDFDLVGMQVATYAVNDSFDDHSSTSITIEGWDDGVLVGSYTADLTVEFAYLATPLSSIDEIRFINDGIYGHWWFVDDITLEFEPQTIPLPTASALAGLGLLGLGVRRRRESL